MHRLLKRNNELGYSLLESIFQLLILGIFLQFVILFFYWKAPIERQFEDYYATEWELFGIELQSMLLDVEEFNTLVGNRTISFINDRGVIEIGQLDSVIRKRVNNTGHVPLYTNIRQAIFTHEDDELLVEVLMRDGKIRERRFVIGLRQE